MRLLTALIFLYFTIHISGSEAPVIYQNSESCQNINVSDSAIVASDSNLLGETVVVAHSEMSKGNIYRYDATKASKTISVIGEPDVVKYISNFPGVLTGIEGTLGLFVRGGNCGSNGIFFDGVPMYVSSHLMGFFSVFPPETIDNVTFYQGGFPSSFGNVSSALLDIHSKRNFSAPYNGTLYISPYLSGLYNSIPIIKDKISLQLSARSTFIPYIWNVLDLTEDKLYIDVYDLSVKLDYKISSKQELSVSYFKSFDRFEYSDISGTSSQKWQSFNTNAIWNCYLSNSLTFNIQAYYSNTLSNQSSKGFDLSNGKIKSELGIKSGLKEWNLNAKGKWEITKNLKVNGGLAYKHQDFSIENETFTIETDYHKKTQNETCTLASAFLECSYDIPNIMDVRAGIRDIWQTTENKKHNYWDFHLLNHIYMTKKYGFELTYDNIHQSYHILEGLPTGWSMNLIVPSNERFPSESTNQYYGGVFILNHIKNTNIKMTLGGYYRKMRGLLSYKDACNAFGFQTDSWTEEVCIGKGESYGLEFSTTVSSSRLSSSLSYTLSKTNREYPYFNDDKEFPFKFDRRHVLNIHNCYTFLKRKQNKKIIEHSLGCLLSYSSGNHVTLPIGTYQGIKPPYWDKLTTGWKHPSEYSKHIYDRQMMSSINSITTKDYFRTDLSYNIKKTKEHSSQELTFSIYNVFNNHNPYTMFCEDGKWKQLSLLPIMPSIRWALSWM